MKYTLLVAWLLTACSATPERPNYYLLANHLPEASSPPATAVLTLNRLVLADYLNQSSLAMLQGEHQLLFANQHIWAEPLQQGISRVLSHDLSEVSGQSLLLPGEPGALSSDFQLELEIHQFLPTDNGEVVLRGKLWVLADNNLLGSESFDFSVSLEGDGYSQSVARQRQLIRLLAEKIASVINGLPID